MNAIGAVVFITLNTRYLFCCLLIILAHNSFTLVTISCAAYFAAEIVLTFEACPFACLTKKFGTFLTFNEAIFAIFSPFAFSAWS